MNWDVLALGVKQAPRKEEKLTGFHLWPLHTGLLPFKQMELPLISEVVSQHLLSILTLEGFDTLPNSSF